MRLHTLMEGNWWYGTGGAATEDAENTAVYISFSVVAVGLLTHVSYLF